MEASWVRGREGKWAKSVLEPRATKVVVSVSAIPLFHYYYHYVRKGHWHHSVSDLLLGGLRFGLFSFFFTQIHCEGF